MACCAFAVFLLAQLLSPFRLLADRLGLSGEWKPDVAVVWTPGVAPALAAPRNGWKYVMLVIVAADISLLVLFRVTGIAADMPRFFQPGTHAAHFEQVLHSSICGPDSRRA